MQRESPNEIDDAAAAWAARLDGGPLSAEEAAALEAWTQADPRHAGALARAQAVLAQFDALGAAGYRVHVQARPQRRRGPARP